MGRDGQGSGVRDEGMAVYIAEALWMTKERRVASQARGGGRIVLTEGGTCA